MTRSLDDTRRAIADTARHYRETHRMVLDRDENGILIRTRWIKIAPTE